MAKKKARAEGLSIKGYRGFRELTIDKLESVNLFVGKNNAGKSSILESVQLLHSEDAVEVMREISKRREEVRRIEDSYRYPEPSTYTDLSHFFYGHLKNPEASFSIESKTLFLEGAILLGEDTTGQKQIFDDQESEMIMSFSRTRNEQTRSSMNERSRERVSVFEGRFMADRDRRRIALPRTRPPFYIAPQSLSNRQLAGLFNEVVYNRAENDLVDALRILDSRVESIHFLASESVSSVDGNGGILVGIEGNGRHPLGSFGDGMRRLLTLSMAIINSAGTVLLIDEIDTGIHYSAMRDMWKLVITLAQRYNVQIFTTTHSYDCIGGLGAFLIRSDSQISDSVVVSKVDKSLLKTIDFSGRELIGALESDTELR